MDISSGQWFTYQAQGTISPTNPAMSQIIASVGQEIAPDYTIEDSNVEGAGFLSSISQALGINGISFQVTLTVLSNLDSDTGSAKTDLDQAFADATGYPLTSSVITGIQGRSTGQPSQAGVPQGKPGPSTPCQGTSVLGICLNTSDTFLIFIVVIVVVLVAAVIISPGTPVAVARSFA